MITIVKTDEVLNKENLLRKVSNMDIFRYYIENFPGLNTKFTSRLRCDKHPTCIVSIIGGEPMYSDFADKTGLRSFDYVMVKYGIQFTEALEKINSDMGLGLKSYRNRDYGNYKQYKTKFKLPSKQQQSKGTNKIHKIKVKRRPFTEQDLEFWGNFNIDKYILDMYEVSPISHYWLVKENDVETRISIPKNKLTYAYRLDAYRYKIYTPKDRDFKWLSNTNRNSIQGIKQLPKDGELLVITKSLKDVMCFASIGIPAIAPQAESIVIDEKIIANLKNRFVTIVSNFDFDYAGIKGTNKLKRLYDIPAIMFTNGRFGTINYGSKDLSDYIRDNGVNDASDLIYNLINSKLNGESTST